MSSIVFCRGLTSVEFSTDYVLKVMAKYAVDNRTRSDICKRTCEELMVPWSAKSKITIFNFYHRRFKKTSQEKMSLTSDEDAGDANGVIDGSVATVRNLLRVFIIFVCV